MDSEFAAKVRENADSTVVDMSGDLTKSAEERLLALREWQSGLAEGKRCLVLNFTEVPYVNSAGIAVLIRLVRYGAKAGFRTFAFGINSHYQKLFRMVGLTEYMAIYPNEYAVLERIAQEAERE
jgi:anti-anti-sigma factor